MNCQLIKQTSCGALLACLFLYPFCCKCQPSNLETFNTKANGFYLMYSEHIFSPDERRFALLIDGGRIPQNPILIGFQYKRQIGELRKHGISLALDYINIWYKTPKHKTQFEYGDVLRRSFINLTAMWHYRLYHNNRLKIESATGLSYRIGRENIIGFETIIDRVTFNRKYMDPGIAAGLRLEYSIGSHWKLFSSALGSRVIWRADPEQAANQSNGIPFDPGTPKYSANLRLGIGYTFGKGQD